MKTGKAHRTQLSSLYSANILAHRCTLRQQEWRTKHGKKIIGALFLVSNAYWRGGHRSANILAHQGPSAPFYWRSNVPCAITRCYNSAGGSLKFKKEADSSVRLTYFHANRLLVGLYKQGNGNSLTTRRWSD